MSDQRNNLRLSAELREFRIDPDIPGLRQQLGALIAHRLNQGGFEVRFQASTVRRLRLHADVYFLTCLASDSG